MYNYQLAYSSISAELLTEQELFDIVSSAMIFNAYDDITGVLIYQDQIFFQVIEGRRDKILRLFSKIELDPRHTEVEQLWLHPISQRKFSDWSMARMDYDGMKDENKVLFNKLEFRIRTGKHSGELRAKSMLLNLIKEHI